MVANIIIEVAQLAQLLLDPHAVVVILLLSALFAPARLVLGKLGHKA